MTDPNDLTHFVAAISGTSESWIERVRAADAEAEHMYRVVLGRMLGDAQTEMAELTDAVFAIAAELRAQRIARRPGAGQT